MSGTRNFLASYPANFLPNSPAKSSLPRRFGASAAVLAAALLVPAGAHSATRRLAHRAVPDSGRIAMRSCRGRMSI